MRLTFPMQALFFISLGATGLGGAIALGALFHCFSFRSGSSRVATNGARAESQKRDFSTDSDAKLDELERRERSFDAMRRRVDEELDAKRQLLEALTNRANEAAEALGRALDSVSIAFGANSTSLRGAEASRLSDSAAPFELNDFDPSCHLEPISRTDVCLRERQARAA